MATDGQFNRHAEFLEIERAMVEFLSIDCGDVRSCDDGEWHYYVHGQEQFSITALALAIVEARLGRH